SCWVENLQRSWCCMPVLGADDEVHDKERNSSQHLRCGHLLHSWKYLASENSWTAISACSSVMYSSYEKTV
ncbi:hypothetical protein A2U01_0014921, partial [Trifolium medium]|nr:hypothetical protein [Trifolium medium]